MGKVDALAFVPVLHDLFTHINTSQPFDVECREVSQDSELVHLGVRFVFSVCL